MSMRDEFWRERNERWRKLMQSVSRLNDKFDEEERRREEASHRGEAKNSSSDHRDL